MESSSLDDPEGCGGPSATRNTALSYARRGWSVIPVPYKSKNPGFSGWEQLRLTTETVSGHFNGHLQNIGVLLGQPSNWLIDVDLDHHRTVELAPEYLPPTPAVFGRSGKPRSHWLYCVSRPAATKKFKSKSSGMLVEFRSTGMQTVFPPSTHESGEPIRWEDENGEPAAVDPDHLLECVQKLADAVKEELGEKSVKRPRKAKRSGQPRTPVADQQVSSDDREKRCLAALLRMGLSDRNDGSHRLYASACRAVEHDLDDTAALGVIREFARQRPFPQAWSDEEIVRRLRDAERRCTRGEALRVDEQGLVPLGARDPGTGRLILSSKRTLPTAHAFVREFHDHPDGRTLHNYAGLLMDWRDNRYAELEDEAIKHRLQVWLHGALRYIYNRQTEQLELVDFESNPGTVNAALDTIRAFVHLPITTISPSWLCGPAQGFPAHEILPCRSTLLHLPTMTHIAPTPAFFTVNSIEFDPDPNAPEPMFWHQFLHQLFEGDIESLDLLQEWFGYCLTGDTSQQKMLLMVGPKRSGKGTIARVLSQLIGSGNICGPTTSGLAGGFGLQPLIGKTLAIVSDARFSGENIATVVERLLCISGEDALTVDRKFLGSITLKVPTRFMFLTNELPRLTDASGALAGRFVIIQLSRSFYGQEDIRLTTKLLGELPGILNWAIEGWRRLRERGHFVQPRSVEDAMREIEDLSSPVGAFVRDECHVGGGCRIDVEALYGAWRRWCDREGRKIAGSKQTFGRDLAAAIAGVSRRRGSGQIAFYEGIQLKAAETC